MAVQPFLESVQPNRCNLHTPLFLTNAVVGGLMMQCNLPPPEACLFNGQPLNMAEIMQPGLNVLYIFAGSTSPMGLSAARLTGSFFRTQHTALREKSCGKMHAKSTMHSLTLIEGTNCLFSAGTNLNMYNLLTQTKCLETSEISSYKVYLQFLKPTAILFK